MKKFWDYLSPHLSRIRRGFAMRVKGLQTRFFSFRLKVGMERWGDLLPVLIILGLVVFSVIFAVIFRPPSSPDKSGDFGEAGPKIEERVFCLENATSTLFAVMIDNMIESRPPLGLSRAELVYEAPTEAGITRFLAFYCLQVSTSEVSISTSEVETSIGPIRSLRPYFFEWAEEWDAPVAHVGGSPEAMARVKNSNVPDLDQYYNGGYFTRSPDRLAPHNVFTNIKKLTLFLNNKFPNFKIEREGWKYKDKEYMPLTSSGNIYPLSEPEGRVEGSVSEIIVDYLRPEHLIKWVYNKNTNSYLRYQNGAEHRDADGEKISAENVIIQITNIEVFDEIGRRKIRTMGEGKAMVFQDGKMMRGTWKRPGKNSITRFYNSAGEEIQFNFGKIWIEIVSEIHKIAVSN